jgi:putative SOS response-associated peptidase YedK
LEEVFGVGFPVDLRPRYNVAPTQAIPIVRQEEGGRVVACARWGLIPAWSRDRSFGGYSTINARAETVATKPAFRAAFRQRRCLIPADGYYEWQAQPGIKTKQPWFITLHERPFAFAGLWERWVSPEGEALDSCSIIVTGANALMQPLHDRMPVILEPRCWHRWLDPNHCDAAELQGLLQPYSADGMSAWPVSTHVNSPRVDVPECIDPLLG